MRALLTLAAVVLLATPAWAVLGESVDSLAADQAHLHGTLRSTVRDTFALHEISSLDGTRVREYASPDGYVFAVSWQGPFVPDLRQLLGSYFPEFEQAVQLPVRRRRPLALETDHLVVETGGHVRAFRGRVYLPAAVPDGVSQATLW